MAIRVGTDGLIELTPTAWTYSPATGQLAVRRFKGPHADAEAYAESLIGTGIEVMLEPIEGTPLSIVTIRDVAGTGGGGGVDSNVETVWTLQPQIEEISVFLHPKVQADVGRLPQNSYDFKTLLKIIRGEDVKVQSTTTVRLDDVTIVALSKGASWTMEYALARLRNLPNVLLAANLYLNGVENYQTTRASLRKSRVVSPNSSITADWDGVGKIYSTRRLVSLERIPNAIIGTLEDGDWYKCSGNVEQMGDGRFTISTEWLYREKGGWDTSLLYERG